jgi:HlyD family secretion protein
VSFEQQQAQQIVVPETAVQIRTKQEDAANSSGAQPSSESRDQINSSNQSQSNQSETATLFIVEGDNNGDNNEATVSSRTVRLGNRADGRVEILSGLNVGDQFVVRSSGALEDGAPVRLSLISETAPAN